MLSVSPKVQILHFGLTHFVTEELSDFFKGDLRGGSMLSGMDRQSEKQFRL